MEESKKKVDEYDKKSAKDPEAKSDEKNKKPEVKSEEPKEEPAVTKGVIKVGGSGVKKTIKLDKKKKDGKPKP